jgi:MFS family permease
MIVESWLNERAEPATRGKIFGAYTMVNLAATTAGQMTLTLGDPNGYIFFVLAAIVYCLALLPTAVSSSASPKPLTEVRLDLRALWRNSPVAVFAVLMVGVSNSAYGALAAVYAEQVGLALTAVALFLSIPILAAAAAQMPVGFLSDRMDRRRVLVAVAAVAALADIAFIALQPESRWINLGLAALFGAAIYTLYPVIVAHANDHAAPDAFIQTSGGLLLVFGVGAIAGPLIAGALMSRLGPPGLFLASLGAHALLIGFTVWRIALRDPVAPEEKTEFQFTLPARASTPESVALAEAEREAENPEPAG